MDTATHIRELLESGRAVADLEHYLTPGAFSGAHFDTIGGRGDQPDVADRFTAADLVAVTMLSVSVPAWGAVRLLHDEADRFSALLAAVTHDPLHEASDAQLEPLWKLQEALNAINGVGHVTRSKLLARKRPHLVPIRDQYVLTALTGKDHGDFTLPLRDALRQGDLVDRLAAVRAAVDGAAELSLLRVLDIVVWMHAHGAASVSD